MSKDALAFDVLQHVEHPGVLYNHHPQVHRTPQTSHQTMSGLSETPDYNKQVYSDRPVGVIFEEDPDKKPNYVRVLRWSDV